MSLTSGLTAVLLFLVGFAAGLATLVELAGTTTDEYAAKSAYQAALDRSGQSRYRAHYEYELVHADAESQDLGLTLTIFGGGNERLDWSAGGTDATSTQLLLSDRAISCTSRPSEGMPGSCTSKDLPRSDRPSGQRESDSLGSASPFAIAVAGLNVHSDEVHVSLRGTRQIAGRAAECFSWVVPRLSVGAEECYGDSGEVLFIDSTSRDGELQMRATEVTNEVSDADLTPPYPIVTQ